MKYLIILNGIIESKSSTIYSVFLVSVQSMLESQYQWLRSELKKFKLDLRS